MSYDQQLADAQQENIRLLHLLALIREACGDDGKRMQDELAKHIAAEHAQVKTLRVFAHEVALGVYRPDELRRRAVALLEKS